MVSALRTLVTGVVRGWLTLGPGGYPVSRPAGIVDRSFLPPDALCQARHSAVRSCDASESAFTMASTSPWLPYTGVPGC